MNRYIVEVVDFNYEPKGVNRILLARSRRKAVEHIASEYGVELTQHQNSLSSFPLPNGDIVFVTATK